MRKLLNIPDEIDAVLKNYKEKTGMSVSSYIQRAIYKAMIHDKLITIKKTIVYVDKKGKVVK